jgi:hypothetical protein
MLATTISTWNELVFIIYAASTILTLSYRELEEILLNRDKTFLSTIFAVTAPTETDPVAKSCVYLAHSRGSAAELIQFFATQEVMSSATENTLFRMNSVSSKMFKFYSKLGKSHSSLYPR